MCMRVDNLIPSSNKLLRDFVTKDPLERCLTRSLKITKLEDDQVSSITDITEAILALEENAEATIVVEDQKTSDVLTLKELPSISIMPFWVRMARNL